MSIINEELVVFISYSRGDGEQWRDRLRTQLEGFAWTKSQLSMFVDTNMWAGDDWEEKIDNAIDKTAVAVLLISPSFLKSGFIQNTELPQFLERHKQTGMPIVPIVVEPCAWQDHPELARLLMRPKDGKPLSEFTVRDQNKQLVEIAREINQLYIRQIDQENNITIVVADDRDFTVRGLRDLFNDELADGMTVVGMARTPDEVDQTVVEFAPDILLLDMSWFRNDTIGLELIDTTRRLSPVTKIIAISNHHDLLEEAKKKGVATMDKDFRIMQLFSRVKEVYHSEAEDLVKRALFESLTDRELEILTLVAEGLSDNAIKDRLVVSLSTVKKHVSNIFAKTEMKSRTGAAVKAKEYGII